MNRTDDEYTYKPRFKRDVHCSVAAYVSLPQHTNLLNMQSYRFYSGFVSFHFRANIVRNRIMVYDHRKKVVEAAAKRGRQYVYDAVRPMLDGPAKVEVVSKTEVDENDQQLDAFWGPEFYINLYDVEVDTVPTARLTFLGYNDYLTGEHLFEISPHFHPFVLTDASHRLAGRMEYKGLRSSDQESNYVVFLSEELKQIPASEIADVDQLIQSFLRGEPLPEFQNARDVLLI